MNSKRIAAITAAGAIAAGGAGAAIAATTAKQAEQDILTDAAKRLDVTPQKLRDALAAAHDAQLDRAVAAGELTQEQADEIKARRKQSGRVLGGPGGRHGHRGDRHGRGFPIMQEVAKALGITGPELREQLHEGKSVADVATAEGKSLDSVKAAVRKAVKARLDADVKADRITQAHADERLAHLEEHMARFDQPGGFKHHRPRHTP